MGIIKAATTIGNNISTTGAITGSGANTLYGNTTIGGALTATSTLTVSGLTTLGNASTTLLSVSNNAYLATTTLSGDLTITGKILNSYQGASNVVIGSQAVGAELTTDGRRNILIGDNAGKVLTTGDANACIGSLSCEALTTGSYNIMLAGYSGADVSTGHGNTQVGGHSGLSDNSYNSVIGFEAGAGLYSYRYWYDGYFNNVVGVNAGAMPYTSGTNHTAQYSNAFGAGAGFGGGSDFKTVTGISNSGGLVLITAPSHGFSSNDRVNFHGFNTPEIVEKNGTGNVCGLNSFTVMDLRVQVVNANSFTVDWCRSAGGATSNWAGGVGSACNGWNAVSWGNNFQSSNATIGISSTYCSLITGEAYAIKNSAGTSTYDHATVIGSHARADCSDCIVLGRPTDNVGIGTSSPAFGLTLNNKDLVFTGTSALASWDTDKAYVYKDSYGGLNLVGAAGTAFDFSIATPGWGNNLFSNPTGTRDVVLGSDLNASNTYSNIYIAGLQVEGKASGGAVRTFTCTTGALTIEVYSSYIQVTNTSGGACVITLGETYAKSGARAEIWNISTDTITIADSDGVQEVNAGGTITVGQWQKADLRYYSDRWMVTQ